MIIYVLSWKMIDSDPVLDANCRLQWQNELRLNLNEIESQRPAVNRRRSQNDLRCVLRSPANKRVRTRATRLQGYQEKT